MILRNSSMSASNPITSGIYNYRYPWQSEFVKGPVMYPDVYLKVLNDRGTGAIACHYWHFSNNSAAQIAQISYLLEVGNE